MNAFVDHFCFALGELQETVQECATRGATVSDAGVLSESGFERHHYCNGSDAYTLARKAVSTIREELAGTGAIVYSTCLPANANAGSEAEFNRTGDVKHLMDFAASRLQSDFELDGAEVIGINQQACTGMLGSIRIANALLASEPQLQKVLCVTADRFPQNARYEQSYCLISDGAAACVVSRSSGRYRFVCHHGVTNGAMSMASDEETIGSFFNHSFAAITAALQKGRLSIDDIAWIVPQNTNKKAWQILSRLLRFDTERVYFPTIADCGHVISGDNIINLAALDKSGLVRHGDKVLLFMAGYGLNWQCLILEKVNDECN